MGKVRQAAHANGVEEMTRDEFEPQFLALLELRSMNVGDAGWELWYKALEDLPISEFTSAVLEWARTAMPKDYPTPGALRRLCPSGMHDDDRANRAWDIAKKAMRLHGHHDSVDFDDWLINATIRQMGGWEAFGEWPIDEDKWKKREFSQLYQSIARHGRGDGSPLLGSFARSNRANCPQDHSEHIYLIETGLRAHRIAGQLARGDGRPALPVEVFNGIGEMPRDVPCITMTPESDGDT